MGSHCFVLSVRNSRRPPKIPWCSLQRNTYAQPKAGPKLNVEESRFNTNSRVPLPRPRALIISVMRAGRAQHLRSALAPFLKNTRRVPASALPVAAAVKPRTGQARHESVPRSSWAAACLGLAFTLPPASALRANPPFQFSHSAEAAAQVK